MSDSVINITTLDYSTVKSITVPNSNTVKFFAGTLFPNNKDLVAAVWDFGDGTSVTTTYSSNSARYTNVVTSLNSVVDFFPRWSSSVDECLGVVVPKFETTHTYSNAGNYSVNVKLVDSSGISYIGTPVNVTVPDTLVAYTLPNNWENISASYTTSNDINFLYNDGIPQVSTVVSSVSSLPITVDFTISNLVGRVDVDYIEWNFGDGTFTVTNVLNSPVIPSLAQVRYDYQLAPTNLVYEPTVTVYFKNKTRYQFAVPQIALIDLTNISVDTPTVGNSAIRPVNVFNITPKNSYTLPVTTKFIHKVLPNLKYIIWNYDDGVYDVTPVDYSVDYSFINQVKIIEHTYSSINYYKFLPKCLLVFENLDGTYSVEQYQSRKYLNYDLSVINPLDNYYETVITSFSNYRKFDNISSVVVYPETNEGYASLTLRLSLDRPKDILLFEKIVWNINGTIIIQDKNTSKEFGYLNIPNIVTPVYDYSITATLYGIPAIYLLDGGNTKLTYYGEYQTSLFILDKDEQEAINANSQIEFNIVPEVTIITTPEGIEITTGIVDEDIQIIVEDQPVYINSTVIFDKLFTAINPAGNLLNREYPTTATTFSNKLTNKRAIGYFRPSKSSNIIIDPGIYSFTINLEAIQYNQPYYFPDPYKYGSNTDVILFYSLDASFKKNAKFGRARREPNQPKDSVSFYGYNTLPTEEAYSNLSYIFDEGYVHNSSSDIYGNVYGLVKDNNNFRKTINSEEGGTLLYLVFNGYKFFDDILGQGYSFNYFLSGTYETETIISGISSFTNGFSALSSNAYTINFGDFIQTPKFKAYSDPIDINTQFLDPIDVGIRDGAYFTLSNTEFLTDPISSDMPGFSSLSASTDCYFTELFEAGVNQAVPYIRPLLSSTYKSQSAIFTQSVRVSGANGVIDINGGEFVTNFDPTDNFFVTNETIYIDSVDPTSVTAYLSTTIPTTESKNTRDNLAGQIVIKSKNGTVLPLTTQLPYFEGKFGSTIYSSLTSGVLSFDMVYDTFMLATSSYLIIDRVKYASNAFVNPKTQNLTVEYNQNLYNTLSNRYKVNNDVYFATLSAYGTPSSTEIFVYPIIYKVNYSDFTMIKVFPDVDDISTYSSEFKLSGLNVLYTEASSPYITFNGDTNVFNITYLLKDQNKSPYLISANFEDKGNIVFKSVNSYVFGSDNYTYQFTSTSTLTSFSTLLSSSVITFNQAMIL